MITFFFVLQSINKYAYPIFVKSLNRKLEQQKSRAL